MFQAGYSSRKQTGINDAGKLDRIISVYTPTLTQDALGAKIVTWVLLGNLWASRHPAKNVRFFGMDGKHFESMTVYRVRHRNDIGPGYRVKAGDDTFEILGVEEMGRRHFLDLTCRAVDQTVGSELTAGDFSSSDFGSDFSQ